MGAITTTAGRPLAARRAAATFGRALVAALRAHRLYLGIILGYSIACVVVGAAAGALLVVEISFYAGPLVLLIALFLGLTAIGHALWVAAVLRPEGSLFAAIGRDFKTRFFGADRIAGFLAAITLAPLFFSTFSSFKRMIPLLNPYSWDPAFMAWDKWLHGGQHVWRLLQPVLGTPIVTSAVSFAYNLWFFVLIFTVIWQAFSRRDAALRMQFLLAFLLAWIVIGTIAAIAFSSAGPVYYGRVTGLPDPYAPLMHYLAAVGEHYPEWSLTVQQMLWDSYQAGGRMLGSGISAMPSMHVAMTVLMALLGWRVSRGLGIAYTAFAVIIQIGAVHLGWHYAIDGYLAAVMMAAIWWGTGRWLVRRGPARQRPHPYS
jgi:hypothetical protein